MLRAQRWSNDMAFLIEHELFGLDSPSLYYRWKQELADRLTVEAHLTRIREQVLPLVDRANRMLLRNMKAIRELSQSPVPAVSVGTAVQVNVGDRQVNVAR
jgi:hypothetical protein